MSAFTPGAEAELETTKRLYGKLMERCTVAERERDRFVKLRDEEARTNERLVRLNEQRHAELGEAKREIARLKALVGES